MLAPGDQTTRYVYGSTLQESFVARSDLLRAEIYPDSDDSPYDDGDDQTYDRIEYSYNAQGERKSLTDQNGTVRGFRYDKLGRLLHDYVESLGSGVDGRVRRISRTYGLAGRLEKLTSYTQPYPKTGAIASQVLFQYSDTGLPVAEYQSHNGAVDMVATPRVQYAYDDSTQAGEFHRGLRPSAVVYPNGRVVRYEYGESASSSGAGDDADDCLNRIKFIADDDEGQVGTHLAEYTRLGLNTIVRVDYTEPQIRYDLAHGTGNDPYAGLDRFGRVVDLLWRNYGTAEDVVRIRHGYDRAGNRLYREDPVAVAHGVDLDEAYTYDGLYQLKTFVRGALNAQKTAIASPTFRQAWDFDTTGNWRRFREDKDGDGRWDLDQTRQHNAANELLSFSASVGDPWSNPAHDRNGNMVRIPQPKDPTRQFTLRYDPWNRLVRVSDPAGPVADYHYDARNFRIVKEVHRDPADPIPGEEPFSRYPETRHFYYNSSWQCLEERSSSSPTVPPDSLPADRQFIWGLRYIDDLLLRDRHTHPGGALGAPAFGLDERLYAMQDPNWNVVAVADSTGAAAERYTYAAYGKPSSLAATFASRPSGSYPWDSLYTAREYDPETRLYHYRNRPYDATTGSYPTRDPIGYDAGDHNQYRYLASRPLGGTDPFGFCESYAPALDLYPPTHDGPQGALYPCCAESPPSETQVEQCGPDITAWLKGQIARNVGIMKQWFGMGPGRPLTSGAQLDAFKNLVKTDGPWDHKKPLLQMNRESRQKGQCPTSDQCAKAVTLCSQCIQYETIANLHYGVMAPYAFYRWFARWQAGAAQLKDQHGHGAVQAQIKAWFKEHWGDEPEDVAAIEAGFDIYDGMELCKAVSKHSARLKAVPAACKTCAVQGTPKVRLVRSFNFAGSVNYEE